MSSTHASLQVSEDSTKKPLVVERGKDCAPSRPSLWRRLVQYGSAEYVTVGSMCLNFFSSTCIVVANKYAMDSLGFRYGSTLTLFHFICTSALLYVSSRCFGLFERKPCELYKVAKLAAGAAGFVMLTNLSLQYNSVGFYQVMKVMTTPTIVVIEALFYQKQLENRLKLALTPVCLGVVLTTATDFRLNLHGTLIASAGVIVTSLYQIWSGTMQKTLQLDALQLQYYTSPMSALFLLPFVPLMDNWRPGSPDSIFAYAFTPYRLGVILMTGVLAFLVNISIFMVIGRTSPVTYNVLGHAKTAVIISSDFLFFGRPRDLRNFAGVLLTMIGVVWYTHLKLEDQRSDAKSKVNDSSGSICKASTASP
jgi:solute carrier family 35 protein E3